jgi:hypothetical protein
MSRPEEPIDPRRPLASFASDLRALRQKRDITYRKMAELTHYCPAILSTAASGRSLPSWWVTRAYVLACGGSTAYWRSRWCEERDLQRIRNGSGHE